MLPINVPVEEFTTPDPITVTENAGLDTLRRLMDEHGVRHLPVVRDERVVGIISDRDVRLISGLSFAEAMQVQAGDIMTTEPLTVRANTTLDQVAFLMSERKVGSAIVNDDDGRLLGIFTVTDALNALIEIVRGNTAG